MLEKGDELYWLDIRFRMLSAPELARAHSFPKSYIFTGTQADQVAQVGNSVPVKLAKALCKEILKQYVRAPKTAPVPRATVHKQAA